MGKGAKREHEEAEVKVPFKVWFPEWLHHKGTGPEDPDRYCGTRTKDQWRTVLIFYFFFYGLLICFWIINYTVMFSYIPERIEGTGPMTNRIKNFGYTQIVTASTDYSTIAADSGSFTGTGSAFTNFRAKLSQTDYDNLQTQINTDAGVSGSQFLYNNCTIGSGGCTAASNYGTFGPVALVTYRNRKWNRPEQPGSTCSISCTYSATFDDGTTGSGSIAADHFWRLNMETNAWENGQASLYCIPFRNQPFYRAFTAVSMQGFTKPPASYTLTCSVTNIEEDGTAATALTFVA